jgi:hypothetical protein
MRTEPYIRKKDDSLVFVAIPIIGVGVQVVAAATGFLAMAPMFVLIVVLSAIGLIAIWSRKAISPRRRVRRSVVLLLVTAATLVYTYINDRPIFDFNITGVITRRANPGPRSEPSGLIVDLNLNLTNRGLRSGHGDPWALTLTLDKEVFVGKAVYPAPIPLDGITNVDTSDLEGRDFEPGTFEHGWVHFLFPYKYVSYYDQITQYTRCGSPDAFKANVVVTVADSEQHRIQTKERNVGEMEKEQCVGPKAGVDN